MSLILNRALQALSRIYRLEGGDTIIPDFETQSPIIPVHDVARIAELGAGIGTEGGFLVHYRNVEELSAGGSTERRVDDPWATVAGETNISITELDLWHMWLAAYGDVNAANITTLAVALTWPVTFPGMGALAGYALIDRFTNASQMGDQAGTGDINLLGNSTANTASIRVHGLTSTMVPFRIPTGAEFTYRMQTGGICNAYIFHMMWAGPKGVTPPGVS